MANTRKYANHDEYLEATRALRRARYYAEREADKLQPRGTLGKKKAAAMPALCKQLRRDIAAIRWRA